MARGQVLADKTERPTGPLPQPHSTLPALGPLPCPFFPGLPPQLPQQLPPVPATAYLPPPVPGCPATCLPASPPWKSSSRGPRDEACGAGLPAAHHGPASSLGMAPMALCPQLDTTPSWQPLHCVACRFLCLLGLLWVFSLLPRLRCTELCNLHPS